MYLYLLFVNRSRKPPLAIALSALHHISMCEVLIPDEVSGATDVEIAAIQDATGY